MKKILQVGADFAGSTGRIEELIAKKLDEKKVVTTVAYSRGVPINSKRNSIIIGSKIDNFTHGIMTRFFDRHGFSSAAATIEFVKKLKMLSPDVIHLHNIHGYYLNVEILFKYLKQTKIPVVWTFHDCWPFTGHCSHFIEVGCQKWKGICFKCPLVGDYPKSFFVDNSKNNFERKKKAFSDHPNLTIVTPSQWLSDLVGESFLANYPRVVINNGVDAGIFKPSNSQKFIREKYNIEEEFILLGVAFHWTNSKGLNVFKELAQKLGAGFKIVLVGVSIQQSIELSPSIVCVERTANLEELAAIYAESDVLVNPTFSDNFPTVNLEALASGIPVITFDTGGSGEAVDKDTGSIVPVGDINELVRAILEVKSKGKRFYQNSCRKRALAFFDQNLMSSKYVELYQKLSCQFE